MKIAILVGGLPPIYNGGTEIATVKIAKYAAKAGHEVHVFAADYGTKGKIAYKLVEDGFKIHRIKTIPPNYWHGLSFAISVMSKLKKFNPDIIHAQSAYMALAAYILYKTKGIPYILYDRGGIYFNKYCSGKPIDKFIIRMFTVLFMKHAERLIAQTNDMKCEMLKYVKRDIEVIPNGIESDMAYKGTKQEARKRLGISESMRIALWVGRDRPEKNLQCFIDAMDLLHQKGIYGMVVGQTRDNKNLMRGNISFIGDKPHEQIPMYMAAADVLVNTSVTEGFPMTVLEGMANSLPIIAPYVGGLPEIVDVPSGGYLIDATRSNVVAGTIFNLFNDSETMIRMGKFNKDKVSQYTWENVVDRLYNTTKVVRKPLFL